jgi:tripartite-type tricarboxylate transporter receptor subunit TctC
MKRIGTKIGILIVLSGLLFVLGSPLLYAQPYPSKPIKLLVGYAPGGAVDNTTRIIAAKAEKLVGQPITISNNGAAGGSVALTYTTKEKPDGYNLISVTTATFALIPHTRPVPYKVEDFTYVLHFGNMQTGLVVRADSPWKTLKEFVDYAKKNPGKVTYGTAGTGLVSHVVMEYVAKREGIQWTLIPYTGMNPALMALLGGHITAASGDQTFTSHVKGGALRLLGTHGENRLPDFPDVPTFIEQGYDFKGDNMFILAGPKGMPPAIVKKLDEVFHKAMEDPEFVQTMGKLGYEITYRNSEDTRKYLEEAYVRFGKVISEIDLPKASETK